MMWATRARRARRRIQQSVRAGDAAARLGGDEFAIVLAAGVEPVEAVHAAERLLQQIGEPIELGRGQLTVAREHRHLARHGR